MGEDFRGRSSTSMRQLAKLDLAAHGAALVSCTAGGVVLESVVLIGAASHHVANIGLYLLVNQENEEQTRIRSSEALFSVVQLIIWTCCLLLAMYVAAMGAHGIFHAEALDGGAIVSFAVPAALAAVTTGVLAWRGGDPGRTSRMADALLSGAPPVLALFVAFSRLSLDAGKLDALVGLATVLMLIARTAIHLGRALD